MKCPTCSHENPDSNKFCAECGTKLEVMSSLIECPQCHNIVPADSKFCPDCGASLLNENKNDETVYWYPYIENDKVGYKDIRTDKVIIKAQFHYAELFHEGMGHVVRRVVKRTNNGPSEKLVSHFINDKRELQPGQYDYSNNYSNGLAKVGVGGSHFFIDKNAKLIRQVNDHSSVYSEGLSREGHKFYDVHGNVVFETDFSILYGCHDGLILVSDGNRWGYIDKLGELIVPLHYKQAREFSEGLAAVKDNDKWGFIDTEGRMVIPCIYDYVYPFSENLAAVQKNDKIGFINKKNEIITPFLFSEGYNYGNLYSFTNGLAVVNVNRNSGVIDKKGCVIVPFSYYRVYLCVGRIFASNVIVCEIYDECGNLIQTYNATNQIEVFVGDGMASMKIDNRHFLVDYWGNKKLTD